MEQESNKKRPHLFCQGKRASRKWNRKATGEKA